MSSSILYCDILSYRKREYQKLSLQNSKYSLKKFNNSKRPRRERAAEWKVSVMSHEFLVFRLFSLQIEPRHDNGHSYKSETRGNRDVSQWCDDATANNSSSSTKKRKNLFPKFDKAMKLLRLFKMPRFSGERRSGVAEQWELLWDRWWEAAGNLWFLPKAHTQHSEGFW